MSFFKKISLSKSLFKKTKILLKNLFVISYNICHIKESNNKLVDTQLKTEENFKVELKEIIQLLYRSRSSIKK
jgi:hypothetical protein